MHNTLPELLKAHRYLADTGTTFIEGSNQEEFLSYQELYHLALRVLAFFQTQGLKAKDELVFQIEDNKTFIVIFWACVFGGILPVPLSIGQNDDNKQKLFKVWSILKNPHFITSRKNLQKLNEFAQVKGLEESFSVISNQTIDESMIMTCEQEGKIFNAKESDIALIQFSSGSTGNPKGVVLTHGNLMANMEAISTASGYSASDSMISWMPLTHDMGLIGFHLNPMLCAMNQYLLPTNLFIRRPLLWLEKASQYKVTILCSPNFGYEYVMKHFNSLDNNFYDLSAVRILYNGAEPISLKLSNSFLDRLAEYGLRSHAMCPVYGLAEASLAVTISDIEEEVISLRLNRNKLNLGDEVSIQTDTDGENAPSFVNVGKAISCCEVRIADNQDIEVKNKIIGHVQIKGANVTSGYYNNETETKSVVTLDGWLKTGDLGFIENGALYITGRAKDILFVNGQNFYPQDVEQIAEDIGVELNKIAVAGFFNTQTEKEEVIAFVLHRGDLDKFIPVVKSLKSHINSKVGLALDRIIPVRDIPKTTSGKLRRFKLLEQYIEGKFQESELKLNVLLANSSTQVLSDDQPQNRMEKILLRIWKKVLRIDTLNTIDNFFEHGGNSLMAVEMQMLFLKEFQIELSIDKLYEKQTIRALSAEIETFAKAEYFPIATERREQYPASSAQRRLYYSWLVDKSSVAYNIPIAFTIIGNISFDKLEKCINEIITRHDSLRMVFQMNTHPKFKVEDEIRFKLNTVKCSAQELDNKLKDLVQPFDLDNGPLFRVNLISLDNGGNILMVDFHHIASDGLSIYKFIDELLRSYHGEEFQSLSIQYKDYACWEKETSESSRIKIQEGYWHEQLIGELPVLEMPVDLPRSAAFDGTGAKKEFLIPEATTQALKNFASAKGCTLNVLLFTVYNILLWKYTTQEEIIVGVPVAGRNHPDIQNVLGMFVNNLAIRTSIKGGESFIQLLEKVKANVRQALNNQEYPFEKLIQTIDGKRDISRNPIFDTMFIFQNMGVPEIENSEFTLSRHFFDPGFSKFDISVEIFEAAHNSLTLGFEYSTQLFKEETVVRLASHFSNLVDSILANPYMKVSNLDMLSEYEYDDHVKGFNATANPSILDQTIYQLFDAQAKQTPDNIAIEYRGEQITFKNLHDKADSFASLLRYNGMVPSSIVGILLHRSPELIISILGILKAGGSYLPIDTDLPPQRRNFIISNSECKLIVAGEASIDKLTFPDSSGIKIINVDNIGLPKSEYSAQADLSTPHGLAYIIYTSGTTGVPKGVMIEHQSLVNYTNWAVINYIKGDACAFPLYTSVSFDLTVTSIFAPLVSGNKIVIYEDDERSLLIEKIIADDKVDIIKLTPSHLKILMESAIPVTYPWSKTKKFIVGGEQFETRLAKEIHNKFNGKVELYNEYGPTEATVGCMIYQFSPEEDASVVPIGKPVQNIHIYLLDQFLKPVATGVKGEIYISGDGVARGYLFNKELTCQKFIPDPFVKGKRMYKTGDLAKRLPNGLIQYIGRFDQQVKINGYRVELSEIENILKSHPCVMEALVLQSTKKNNQRNLCAYYKSGDNIISESLLRDYLVDRLPYYMIPVNFVMLDKIPLTKNGKVDYNKLPEPVTIRNAANDLLPKTRIEELSSKIWKAILGEQSLTIHDNFFELGGDSIKAVQIASRLFEQGVVLKVKDILKYQTIEQISLHAEIGDSKSKYDQGIINGDKNLTPVESWFFSHNFKNPNYYNQSVLLKLDENVNITLLQYALKKVIEHHDGFRINLKPQSKTLYYSDRLQIKDFVIDTFEISDSFSDLVEISQRLKTDFDITKDLLIRAAIFRSNVSKLLFITAHHLVMDGISWRILLEDLHTVYNSMKNKEQVRIPQKTASLIQWQKELYEYSQTLIHKHHYWQEIEKIRFTIPMDFDTHDWKVENTRKVTRSLDEEDTSFLLKDAHRPYRTDVPILLNTALALTLREWTGLDLFIIELENHGRHLEEIDVSRTVGWFTALYPLKLELNSDSLSSIIKAVKEQIRKAPSQGIDYGIFKHMTGGSSSNENQMSEIRFNYLGQFGDELNNELFTFINHNTGSDTDPANDMTTKLELNAMVMDGVMTLEINYNSKAHERSTVEWLVNEFFTRLTGLLAHIRSENDIHFTPTDFDAIELDDDFLKALFK